MSKYENTSKKVKHKQKKISCVSLYLYAELFDDLKEMLNLLVDDETNEMLLELSEKIHSQIPHLECDAITDSYIVEVGYDYVRE